MSYGVRATIVGKYKYFLLIPSSLFSKENVNTVSHPG